MYKKDPNKEVLDDGLVLIIINNDFAGRTHNLLPGMKVKECIDGWFQVYNNHSYKHSVRLSPDFVKNIHKNNFKPLI